MSKVFRISLLSALFMGLLMGCVTPPGDGKPAGMVPGLPKAPEVAFTRLDGSTGRLSEFRGQKVVVVNFWGLRCQNCIEEMPFLERLHHKYANQGLVILGVNTDGLDHQTLPRFLPQLPLKLSFPVLVDPDFSLVDAFQMVGAPLTVVISKDGTVRFRHEGYTPEVEAEYVALIEKLLAE